MSCEALPDNRAGGTFLERQTVYIDFFDICRIVCMIDRDREVRQTKNICFGQKEEEDAKV